MDAIGPTAKKLHPLVATAAVAVTVVCVLGAIVLISDQVAAHRAPDSATATSADTRTGSAAPAAAAQQSTAADQSAAQPEQAIAPMPAPARKPARTTQPKPVAPAAVAAAAAPPPPASTVPPEVAVAPPPPAPVCNDCGIVAGVRTIKTAGQGSGVGAVAGGAIGGLVGNQFGHGGGKTAMTVLGVLGGALGGNQVEKEVKATTQYVVDVRLDNGQMRTVSVPGNPGAIVGMRVRIENGQLVREAAPQS